MLYYSYFADLNACIIEFNFSNKVITNKFITNNIITNNSLQR